MSKVFYNLAKKNYPDLWSREMVDNLHNLGRLTDEEYADVVGGEQKAVMSNGSKVRGYVAGKYVKNKK